MILQIFINYDYLCYVYDCNLDGEIYYFNNKNPNPKENIIDLIKQDGLFIKILEEEEQTEELCKLYVQQNGLSLESNRGTLQIICSRKWLISGIC